MKIEQILEMLKVQHPEYGDLTCVGDAKGGNNQVYFVEKKPSADDPRTKIVIKIPFKPANKLSSPERAARLWNEVNATLIAEKPYLQSVNYGEFSVAPFITSAKIDLPDEKVADYLCGIYIATGRLILDPHNDQNMIQGVPALDEKQIGNHTGLWLIDTDVLVNWGSALEPGRRGSIVSSEWISEDNRLAVIRDQIDRREAHSISKCDSHFCAAVQTVREAFYTPSICGGTGSFLMPVD